MTVADLGQRLGSRELSEWYEVYRDDPWDRNRQDYMMAQVAAIIFNAWRGKDTPAMKITDIMPYWREPVSEQTPQEQIKLLKAAMPSRKPNG